LLGYGDLVGRDSDFSPTISVRRPRNPTYEEKTLFVIRYSFSFIRFREAIRDGYLTTSCPS
jgi:hypothetical protein